MFRPYGISSDTRHLGLIADYMTHGGYIQGCSRQSITTVPSPLLKMTFETAFNFLREATVLQHVDNLRTPSSRLVLGRVCDLGTGSVAVAMRYA